jgi:hypothetical protein
MLGAALWLLGAQPVPPPAAQPAPPQPAAPQVMTPPGAEDTLEGVTVTGQRNPSRQSQVISAFVRELEGTTVRDRMPRWEGRVCPGVSGLEPAKAAYILDRIAEEAVAVGVEVAKPGCKPSVLIVVTTDPNTYAEAFRRKQPGFFADKPAPGELQSDARGRDVFVSGSPETGGAGQRLRDFLVADRPVRWWHVSSRTETFIPNAGRIYSPVREDLSRALIIVDADQLGGVTWEQLAGYLAMVVLAHPGPNSEPRQLDSILALFADRAEGKVPVKTLTAWDRGYLKGLYGAPEHVRNLTAQRAEIQRTLERLGAVAP